MSLGLSKHLSASLLVAAIVLGACSDTSVPKELEVAPKAVGVAESGGATVSVDIKTSEFVGGNFTLEAALDEPEMYCLDVFGFGSHAMTIEPLSVHTCKPEGWRDATFQVDYPNPGQIYMPAYDKCVEVARFERGAHLFLQTCSETPLQRFVYRDDQTLEMQLRAGPSAFCVVAHPADGIGTGGPSHVRREVYVYDCERMPGELKQWVLPEDGKGLAPPISAGPPAGPPANPEMAQIAGFYQGVCSGCHGEKGEGNVTLQSPKLSGQEDWYLIRSFNNYVNGVRGVSEGERWGSQMAYHVSDLPRGDLAEQLAAYIQTLPDEPAPKTISGNVDAGKALYDQYCALCHGGEGLGVPIYQGPRLAGMTDWYMLRQMYKFQDGRRGTHGDDIYGAQMAAGMSVLETDQEMQDVIAYINTFDIN